MASYSQHKNLELPTSPEHYNINVFNKNAMVIDSELHKLDIKNQSQDELLATKEELNSEISRAVAKENDIEADLESEITRAIAAEDAINQVIETKANQIELQNYLPITGGILSSENGKILTFMRNNQTGGVEILFSNESHEIMSLLVNLLEQNGQFTLYDRIIESDIFSVSAKKRKIYDYKTDELKEILVEGEALPITGGTLENSNKAILKIKRASDADVSIAFENLKQALGEIGFNIYKELVATDKNGIIKKVLLNGDALPITGGTIEGNSVPILSIKRSTSDGSASLHLIPNNLSRQFLRVQSVVINGAMTFKVIDIDLDAPPDTNLFEISKNKRTIYDYKTNSVKEILVQGEALPITGGTLSTSTKTALSVNNSSDDTNGVEIKFSKEGNGLISLIGEKNGIFRVWSFLESRLLLSCGWNEFLYKGKKVFVEGDTITVNDGTPMPLTVLNESGNYVGVVLNNISPQFGESKIRLVSESANEEKRFLVQEISGEIKTLLQLSEKKRKIYDADSGTLKKILVEGESLPVTGGTLTKDGRDIITFNNLGTKEGIQGSDVVLHFNNQGDEYSQIVMRKTDDGVMFMIWDTLNTTKDIFHVTQKEITYKGKKILVEGEALPVSGGTIESSAFPMLKLKSVGGNKIAAFDLIPEQEKEIKLRIQSGYDTGKGNASFDFFEINDGNILQLCTLTKNGCKFFDPVSNTLKKIIVEGEALPVTGGKITDSKRNVLYLNNSADNANDVEIIFQVNNADKMALSGRENGGIGVYDFVNKQTLLEATNNVLRYKGKNILIEGDSIDNCKVNGKKVSEILNSTGSNTGIIYSSSEPTALQTGMTWIGN